LDLPTGDIPLLNIQKHIAASFVLISFLIFNCFRPSPDYGLIFWCLSILTGFLFFLDHKEKEQAKQTELRRIEKEFQSRIDLLDRAYAQKLDRLEDELGKLSLSMVNRAPSLQSNSPTINQSFGGKKIQF
jgi:hypothetical protein